MPHLNILFYQNAVWTVIKIPPQYPPLKSHLNSLFNMKNPRFHLFYLAIIVFLGFQYWSKNRLLESTHQSLSDISTQLKNDNDVIQAANMSFSDEIEKRGVISPKFQIFVNTVRPVEKRTKECVKLLNDFNREFVQYCGGWDSTKNTIMNASVNYKTATFFNNSRIQELKDSVTKLSAALCNIEDEDYKVEILKRLKLPTLLKEESYWIQLPHLTHGAAFAELLRLSNLISIDETCILNFNLNKVSSYHEIKHYGFRIAIAPKKAALIEGETFESDIYLTTYALEQNLESLIALSVNGQNIPFNGGTVHYQSPPQSVGKKSVRAVMSLKNPATGEVVSRQSEFEYEVLPKCKKECQ